MIKKILKRYECMRLWMGGMFLLAVLFMVSGCVSVQAAVKKTAVLGSGAKTVCKADLDGDGREEKLELKISYDADEMFFSNVSFLVDGKEALSYEGMNITKITADYLAMDDANIFLRIVANSDNDFVVMDRFYVYDARDHKLVEEVKLLDEQYPLTNSWAEVKNVTDAKIAVTYRMQFDEIGQVRWTSSYVLKEGKLQLKSNTMKVKSTLGKTMMNEDAYGSLFQENKFQAMKKIRFYKNTDLKNLSYTAKPKDILKLTKLKYVQDRFYVQFSNGTKTGWMKLGQDDVENPSGYFYGVTARLAG